MKRTIACLLLCLSLFSFTAAADGQPIPILMYHHLTESNVLANPLVLISPATFKSHLQALQQAGYVSITFDQYKASLEGKFNLPEKPILITFDDGYTSNYEVAYPMLKELGMKGTIFVITDSMGLGGEAPHFTWEQALEMQKSGVIDIQSHTNTHLDLTGLSKAEQEKEVRYSRFLIESKLGKPCTVLAYPYGFWNSDLFYTAKWAGYALHVKVGNQIAKVGDGKDAPLTRLTVRGNWNADQLLKALEK